MERDILKEAAVYFAGESKYTFVKSRFKQYPVELMCQVLNINRSGFYALQKKPLNNRVIEDKRLFGKIKQFWLESC